MRPPPLQPDLDYQLAFFTPGIKPLCANSRNFIRDTILRDMI